MSVRIKVSYITDEELSEVINLLSPVVVNYKVAKNNKGTFKRAYIELNHGGTTENEAVKI